MPNKAVHPFALVKLSCLHQTRMSRLAYSQLPHHFPGMGRMIPRPRSCSAELEAELHSSTQYIFPHYFLLVIQLHGQRDTEEVVVRIKHETHFAQHLAHMNVHHFGLRRHPILVWMSDVFTRKGSTQFTFNIPNFSQLNLWCKLKEKKCQPRRQMKFWLSVTPTDSSLN